MRFFAIGLAAWWEASRARAFHEHTCRHTDASGRDEQKQLAGPSGPPDGTPSSHFEGLDLLMACCTMLPTCSFENPSLLQLL